MKVYRFESADGAGRASDIIIQAVARFSTMAIIPVVLCSAVLYFLVRIMFNTPPPLNLLLAVF